MSDDPMKLVRQFPVDEKEAVKILQKPTISRWESGDVRTKPLPEPPKERTP